MPDTLKRAFVLAIIGVWMVVAGVALAAAAEKSLEALEREYQAQKNPRKRAKLALAMMDRHLQQLHSAVKRGTALHKVNPVLEGYLAALDRLAVDAREAAHTGTSKSIEVELRRHVRDFENLKMNVSFLERAPLEKVIARVVQVREEVLYSIMHPRKE